MPRVHSRVSARLWSGDTGRELRNHSAHVRLVQIWLITNEPAIREPYGLYHVEMDVAVVQIGSGVSEELFLDGLSVLCDLGFCRWDARSRFVWVVNMAAEQLLENWQPLKAAGERPDWRVVGARRWYATCRDNPFLGPFYDLYAPYLGLEVRRQAVRLPPPKAPSEGASKPRTSTDQDPDLAREGGVGGEQPVNLMNALRTALERVDDPGLRRRRFEEWWAIYPVQAGKGAAWEEYERRRPPHDRLMATTRAYLESEEWAERDDGRRAIPNPKTFLHEGRWDDTPRPLAKRRAKVGTNDYYAQGDARLAWQRECARLGHQPACESEEACTALATAWRAACLHTPRCERKIECETRRMNEARTR